MTTSNDQKSHLTHVIIIAGLIVANIAVTIWSSQKAENLEIMKVWGKENYEKLQLIMQSDSYKEQYAQNLDMMLEQIKWESSSTGLEEEMTGDEFMTGDMDDTTSWMIVENSNSGSSDSNINMVDMNESQG